MSSTDWDLILNVNVDDLDDEKAELLYDQLIEINPDDESNLDRLKRAFKAAKCVMQVKALQADVAIEELEEYIKKNDKNELESLRKQVELYKSTLVGQHGIDPVNRIEDYQNQIGELRESLEAKNNELTRSKRRIGDLEKKLQINEKEIEGLQDEIESLKEEIESRQHGIQDNLAESTEPLEKLREKNKQIQTLLDELDLMERANVELARQVKTLKDQLESATREVKSAADEMESMRSQCCEIQEMNEMLVKEKEYLLKEVDGLRNELSTFQNKQETLVSSLNEKIASLVATISEKNELIDQLTGQLGQIGSNVEQQSSLSNLVSEKSGLIKDLSEKSRTIDYLKDQLAEAVLTIQGQNELIKRLTNGETNDKIKEADEKSVNQLITQIKEMKEKVDKLEDELKIKDEELHQVTLMKTAYEKGEYGLVEALNEIKSLKKQLLTKERQYEETIQELNQLNMKLNYYKDQLDYLKEIGKLNGLSATTLSPSSTSKANEIAAEVSNEQLKILRLQQTVIKLEDEKINLQEKLREARSTLSSSGIDRKLDEERSKMVSHLKNLQDENRELQLGMKEILVGLRESDSQSDVVIDCPSLERLINLLEGRSLSADLTNVIALKAELDLLRGHNQQLRMELKRLRHEHLKLIGEYTNEILNSRCRSSGKRRHSQPAQRYTSESDASEYSDVTTTSTTTTASSTSTIVNNENETSHGYELSEGEVLLSKQLKTEGQTELKNPTPATDNQPDKILCNDDDDEDDDDATTIIESTITDNVNQINDNDDDYLTPPKPAPRHLKTDCETQTEESTRLTKDNQAQSDPIELERCSKCPKLLLIVSDIKEQIERLGESIAESESHYVEQVDLIRKENDWLQDHIQSWKEKYSQLLLERDEMLTKLSSETRSAVNCDSGLPQDETENTHQLIRHSSGINSNKTIPKVLETIIQCLQKQIDQKESAIQEYQALMRKTHENYEKEIAKLVEEKSLVRESLPLDPINLSRIVQVDELRNALEKCLKELSDCKTEACRRIKGLIDQLEKEQHKSQSLQEQLDRIKKTTKSSKNKPLIGHY